MATQATPDPPPTAGARRGRPRSEKIKAAILKATAELLCDRPLAAVSLDAVAGLAGVSKATIYRWWPTKETLAMDALYQEWAAAEAESAQRPDHSDDPAPSQNTGSLRDDLRALLVPWVRLTARSPYGRTVAALLVEVMTNPAFGREYRSRFVQPRRESARAILNRAIERGDIAAGIDIDMVLDLLYGPIYHRLLHAHAPLDVAFTTKVIDTVVDGIEAGPQGKGHRDDTHPPQCR